MTAETIQIGTGIATLLGVVAALWAGQRKADRIAGADSEALKRTAEDTQQIKAGVKELRRTNGEEHTAIHGRFDSLPCSAHGERLAVVETKLEE